MYPVELDGNVGGFAVVSEAPGSASRPDRSASNDILDGVVDVLGVLAAMFVYSRS